MNFQKKCAYCHEWFVPEAWNYRRQKACGRKECQRSRHRRADHVWHLNNPTYDDGREKEQRAWRQTHSGYWKVYRKNHPAYVKRNRRLQKKRNARNRGLIANQDGWNSLHHEKLKRIRRLGLIAKQDGRLASVLRQSEQIRRYLNWRWLIANQDGLDDRKVGVS